MNGNWEATVLLICGGSSMGKSYAMRQVLRPQYGAVCRLVDRVYSAAIVDAGMFTGSDIRSQAAKVARRQARDRRWANDAVRVAFFASYSRQIGEAMHEGRDKGVPIALEGGTLRLPDEAEIVVEAARQIHGPATRVVRASLEVPYEIWLRNRVQRIIATRRETIELRKLTESQYQREIREALPTAAVEGLEDRRLDSAAGLHELMKDLNRAAGAVSPL